MGIKVNADYESVLFHKRSSSLANQSLEFLALFLLPEALATYKTYSEDYLQYVEEISGNKPRIEPNDKSFTHWWGPLKDLEKERVLNSKVTSTQLMMDHGMSPFTRIIRNKDELFELDFNRKYLLKDPYAMSGRGFKIISSMDEAMLLSSHVKSSPFIAEPLFDRVHDFSHFVFADGKSIAYQNRVDKKFQYKGTLFANWQEPSLEHLPFYHEITSQHWINFQAQVEIIKQHYLSLSLGIESFGFSIDSFTYREQGEIKIRPVSEINFRRTMGYVAYELAKKYGDKRPWAQFLLDKSYKDRGGFSWLKKQLAPLLLTPSNQAGVIILSPGDSRLDMFFLSACDAASGQELMNEMKKLLA